MDALTGKSAIVTGAAQGLGAAVAERFVAEGARVVIADADMDRAERAAAMLGPAALAVHVDVGDEAQVADLVQRTIGSFGRLDVMVNNAGVLGPTGSIADIDVADFDRTIAIHLRGVFLGTKHAAIVMKQQRSGVIINTASTAGVQGGLGPHTYTAAKHGVVGLTKSTAVELVRYNVRVNAVAPEVI